MGKIVNVFLSIICINQKTISLRSFIYTTFTTFSMKYLVVCMVYTDDGGIK